MTTTPDWRRPEAEAAAPQLQRLSDFFDGTDAVRANVRTYLPQLEKESAANYRLRSTGVAVPGALTRTIEASVARIFAVPPAVDTGAMPDFDAWWEDVDGMGTQGDVWLSRVAVAAVRDGFALALADAPPAPSDTVPLTEADQFRPRLVLYHRRQLLNWRVARRGGQVVPTMIALAETADVPDGAWGITQEPRVRVLASDGTTVTATVWAERETAGQTTWVVVEQWVYRGPTEIPIALLAAGKLTAPFVARPPLLALCDKVIEYWQVASDIRHNERMACFPQPVIVGQLAASPTGEPGQLVLGPTSAVQVDQGGDFKWAELSGASLEQLRAGQQERLREIGALGLSFLVTETRQAETAKAKALDAAAENATLADAARGIEDGMNVALLHVAAYVPGGPTPAAVSLNKNLSGDVIDAPMLTVLTQMRAAGELTRAEFREILARGRVIPAEMATADAIADAETEAALSAALREPDAEPDA